MKRDTDIKEQSDKGKKPSRRLRYKLAAVVLLLFAAGYIYKVITWQQKSDPVSDAIICQAAARELNKDPNELTRKDFANITSLYLQQNERFLDLTTLKKFTNLKRLHLYGTGMVRPVSLPKWIVILEKLRLYKRKPDKIFIDLSILDKLPNLETLTLTGPVADLNTITRLKNLKELNIERMTLDDIEPIKELAGLEKLRLRSLRISGYSKVSLEPIKYLTNLQELEIKYNRKIYDIEPLKGLINLKKLSLVLSGFQSSYIEVIGNLTNLQELLIDFSSIWYGSSNWFGSYGSNNMVTLEPIKKLTSLRKLWLNGFHYIDGDYNYDSYYATDSAGYRIYPGYGTTNRNYLVISKEQLEEIQRALPELEINQ